jgi:ribosomal protein L7Ae-like RNA K-turn-binding protein
MAQAKLVLIAADLSSKTAADIRQAAKAHSVPLIKIFTGAELSQAIGRQRKVVAIADAGFAQALMKKINQGA